MKRAMLAKSAAVALAAMLAACTAIAQDAQPSKGPQPKQTASHPANSSDVEQGQQVFDRNCSRCHKTPEVIPPSISGTVALHMRIRAGLSEKDGYSPKARETIPMGH